MFRAKEYVKAESLKEAYELNQKRSSVVIGGMMWLKMENLYKVTAIDLSDLGLDGIEEDEEAFRIGCMCSLRKLELHEGLNRYFDGVFRECTRWIVGTQFRNGATVGGSVFGRYGFSDILTCLMMLDTYVELYAGGIIPLKEFAAMKYDRDILVRILIKKDGRRAAYVTQRRSRTDFPLIACGVAEKDGEFYVSVGARPQRAKLVVMADVGGGSGSNNVGTRGSDSYSRGDCNSGGGSGSSNHDSGGNGNGEHDRYSLLAKAAVEQLDFHDNMRGSGEYRKHLAEVYVRRLMEQLDGEEK